MFKIDGIRSLADSLRKRFGLDEETALQYAAAIGDTPEFDKDGAEIIVRGEKGVILARLSNLPA
jgi:hypothetical protein